MATAAKLVYTHIVKQPGYCGGKATIGNSRVRVNNVVWLHKQGHTPAQILEIYPDLSLAQLHAALAYYYDHVEEIEAEFARDDEAETNFEERKTQVLADRARRSPR
jgi:uncharacterized protein (DUF433 family)